MLSHHAAKLILKMPSKLRKPLCKYVVNKYIDKYADIRIKNEHKLEDIKAPVIFVCNHLSNADGLILNKILNKFEPYFVAGIKLGNNPVSSIGLDAVNIIPIRPNTADIESMKKCIEKTKEGKSILIFPEGTRSRSGRLMEGKKGVILIAQKSNIPIVPISLIGTEKLMPINDSDMEKEKFHYTEVHVNIGEAFKLPSKVRGEDKEEYNNKCINMIMGNIAELLPQEYK